MNALVATLLLLGTVLFVLAATGLVRMPDLYTRMQAASKASALGIALVMLGVAFHFGTAGVVVRSLAVVIFFFVTAPVSAHVIARAAYHSGVRPWHGRAADDEQAADELSE